VIHPTATVDAGAQIGAETAVWHYTHVRSTAVIGAYCTIGQGVYVDEDVTIGDHVKIQNGVSVYKGVRLHDYVFVGPNATFTNDLAPRSQGTWWVVPTVIWLGASIGANATILCGVEIGPYAMVGAGAVVTHDVPAHGLVVGNPARLVGWVCEFGHRMPRLTPCVQCGALAKR
jgi:acetyltransferase-like isoleucine patch superfamily enzyme